jgi:hypothetical protein
MNVDDWLNAGEQWWAPHVLDVEAATYAEKAEGMLEACAVWHKVAEVRGIEAEVLGGTLAAMRECVDEMRLWEPHTYQHQAALRRLQEKAA